MWYEVAFFSFLIPQSLMTISDGMIREIQRSPDTIKAAAILVVTISDGMIRKIQPDTINATAILVNLAIPV